jgi:hypothetical protein
VPSSTGGQAHEVQHAVARALKETHPHHEWIYGPPNEDGKVPLWLKGGGEFHDHFWLIAEDGRVEVVAALEHDAS